MGAKASSPLFPQLPGTGYPGRPSQCEPHSHGEAGHSLSLEETTGAGKRGGGQPCIHFWACTQLTGAIPSSQSTALAGDQRSPVVWSQEPPWCHQFLSGAVRRCRPPPPASPSTGPWSPGAHTVPISAPATRGCLLGGCVAVPDDPSYRIGARPLSVQIQLHLHLQWPCSLSPTTHAGFSTLP